MKNKHKMNTKKDIKLLAMDVDGVLTDGSLLIGSEGEKVKKFNVKDGLGITAAIENDIIVALISGRSSEAVNKRAENLGIEEVFQNIENKSSVIRKILTKHSYSMEQLAYIGDDLNDISIIRQVGFSVAVNNAAAELKEIADYVTSKDGGNGAVREVIELILKEKGRWDNWFAKFENFT